MHSVRTKNDVETVPAALSLVNRQRLRELSSVVV